MEHVLRLPDGRAVTLRQKGPGGRPYAEKKDPDGDIVTVVRIPGARNGPDAYRLRILSPDRAAVMLEAESVHEEIFAGLLSVFWPADPGGGNG